MMERKLIALSALILAIGLTGCTAIERATSDEGDDSEALTYWSMWSEGEPQQVALQQAIDDFTADTGVTVNVEWMGRDNIRRLSPTLSSSAGEVDLIDAAQRNIKSVLVHTDSSHDLTSLLDAEIPGEDVTVGSTIPTEYLDMVTQDGATWMIPYQVISSAFWFNGAAHPELVSDPPTSWEELMAWLDGGQQGDERMIALDGDIQNFNLYYYAEMAVANTGPGELYAAAGDETGEAFRQEGFTDAAHQIEELVDGGYFIDGYSSSKWPAMQQEWAQGEADLLYNGTWIPHETRESIADDFEYRAFPMPSIDGEGPTSQEVSFIGFGIPANADNSAAAEQFIAYFMNTERLSRVSTIAGNMTPREDIEVPEELADIQTLIVDAPEVHGQFDGIIDDYSDWTTNVLIPLVNQLVFGEISADEFSETLPEASASYWSRNG